MNQVLIIGFGKTGKAFYRYEQSVATVSIYDDKPIEFDEPYLPYDPDKKYDYALISPGISPSHPVWQNCLSKGIPVHGEIEYAFQQLQGQVIGITGTNGKTTTTTLVYEMVKHSHDRTFLAGNIGFPLLDYVSQSQPDDYYVTELSSFQLETTSFFRPVVAAITNITPDHIQWHGTMEHYIAAKFKIFQNMTQLDQVVINRDDHSLVQALQTAGYSVNRFFGFSHDQILDHGCFVDSNLVIYQAEEREVIIPIADIKLTGIHNLENCLCAISLAKKMNVPTVDIVHVLKTFAGIAHRYEVVGVKQGRRFINDSKATNPDSTIPALKSILAPTIWIAGGMDKGSDFGEMFAKVTPQVKRLILFGENKALMAEAAKHQPLLEVDLVDNLDQAFAKAMAFSEPGYDILLSPASASWDMYPSFEIRGDHFKRLVGALNV